MLNGYITNLGKYNEGELVGKWIEFPITEEELDEVFEEIGINEEYEEFFFTDWELETAYNSLYQEFKTFLHGCFRFGVIGTKRYAQLSADLDGVVAEYIRRARHEEMDHSDNNYN